MKANWFYRSHLNLRGAATLVLGMVVCSFAACGNQGSQLKTHEVSGKVVLGGAPVANATVIFHPNFDLGVDVSKPRGTTNDQGVFTLSTYGANDGAPEGEYEVTVEQWTTTSPDRGPESRLAPKFGKPKESGLTAKVSTGKNELPAFDLK